MLLSRPATCPATRVCARPLRHKLAKSCMMCLWSHKNSTRSWAHGDRHSCSPPAQAALAWGASAHSLPPAASPMRHCGSAPLAQVDIQAGHHQRLGRVTVGRHDRQVVALEAQRLPSSSRTIGRSHSRRMSGMQVLLAPVYPTAVHRRRNHACPFAHFADYTRDSILRACQYHMQGIT